MSGSRRAKLRPERRRAMKGSRSLCSPGRWRQVAIRSGDDGEGRGVDGEGGLDADLLDEQAAEGGAADARDGEADVQQPVAGPELARGLQDGVDGAAGEPARGEHEDAVDQREREHERQRERPREQRQEAEADGLADVERGEHAPQRELVQAGRQRGRRERGDELRRDEQRRRGERVLGLAVHEDRERDETDVVADRVQRVGGEQPPERPDPEGGQVRRDGPQINRRVTGTDDRSRLPMTRGLKVRV